MTIVYAMYMAYTSIQPFKQQLFIEYSISMGTFSADLVSVNRIGKTFTPLEHSWQETKYKKIIFQ